MFARLSAVVFLALPLLAFAGDCSTGELHCCETAQDAKSTNAFALVHSLLGVDAQGTGQAALTCSPITAIGVSGNSCNSQVVCCSNNNFNGVVALGCTPINANL